MHRILPSLDTLDESVPDAQGEFLPEVSTSLQSQRSWTRRQCATDAVLCEFSTSLKLFEPKGQPSQEPFARSLPQALHQLEATLGGVQQPHADVFLADPALCFAWYTEGLAKPCLESLVKLLDNLPDGRLVQFSIASKVLDSLNKSLTVLVETIWRHLKALVQFDGCLVATGSGHARTQSCQQADVVADDRVFLLHERAHLD
mmetsp:Transcript_18813/g.53153  ORF Transcript_18813/g.53153 Transcript_18813/m.53153 type:complete len:202 (-) Transcript_18813:252-857(-)